MTTTQPVSYKELDEYTSKRIKVIYWVIGAILMVAIPLVSFVYSTVTTEAELANYVDTKTISKDLLDYRFNEIDKRLYYIEDSISSLHKKVDSIINQQN